MTTLYNQIKNPLKTTKISNELTIKIPPAILHEFKILILTNYDYDIPIDENYRNLSEIMSSRYSEKIINPLHENMYLFNWINDNV